MKKYHRCVNGSQMADQYGVHRATIMRVVEQMVEKKGVPKGVYKLGHEFVFTPTGIKHFEEFVLNKGRWTQLGGVILARREKGIRIRTGSVPPQISPKKKTRAKLSMHHTIKEGDFHCSEIAGMLGVKPPAISKWVQEFFQGEQEVPITIAYTSGNTIYFTEEGRRQLFDYVLDNSTENSSVHRGIREYYSPEAKCHGPKSN